MGRHHAIFSPALMSAISIKGSVLAQGLNNWCSTQFSSLLRLVAIETVLPGLGTLTDPATVIVTAVPLITPESPVLVISAAGKLDLTSINVCRIENCGSAVYMG